MAVVMCLKVHFHFEGAGGKKAGEDQIRYVQVLTNDYAAIKAVLSSNNLLRPGTLVIDSVANAMAGGCLA
jgi:hypothetical protein